MCTPGSWRYWWTSRARHTCGNVRAGQPTTMLVVVLATLVLALTIASNAVNGLSNGLARTPIMGWSTWNTFRCDYTEADIRGIADTLVSSGLAAAGYRYLNIDDCWESDQRDSTGALTFNTTKFPSGLPALAAYVHSKGLLFGLYTSSGPYTCAGFPGSWGHEAQDAKTFAKWGVDFLKLDACAQFNVSDRAKAYTAMSRALLDTGRPIVFYCDSDELILYVNNREFPHQWAPAQCNFARIHYDIWDSWLSITDILTAAQNIYYASQPGYFNDLDQLIVGMGALTDTEYTSHFQLWCLLSSSLIIGNDIRTMTDSTKKILMNSEAIAINQDRLGVSANMVRRSLDGSYEIWAKPLYVNQTNVTDTVTAQHYDRQRRRKSRNHSFREPSLSPPLSSIPQPDFQPWPYHGLVLFNRASYSQDIFVDFTDLFDHKLNPHPPSPVFVAAVRDVWNRKDLGVYVSNFTATSVASHGSRLITVRLIP